MIKPFLIALDWGSTRFRGWLLDSNGIEIDKIDEEFGILKIDNSQYLDVFEKQLGLWIKEHGSIPIIAVLPLKKKFYQALIVNGFIQIMEE